jgi:hypothetical protein
LTSAEGGRLTRKPSAEPKEEQADLLAWASDRERIGIDGTRVSRDGLEVRLASAAVPPGADPGRPGPLDRATLAGWVKRTAWWLKSLYEIQLRTIQASPRLFCNETPMSVLDPRRHRTRICQFWANAMDDRP